jgi:lysophospholipase L1-like esterase
MMNRIHVVKPGMFSPLPAAADTRRFEFDVRNECLLVKKTPLDFVFIGDSITQLWELDAFFHSEKGAFINRGIAGDVTQFVAKRIEADALQLKPNHIVLMVGVNDTFKMDGAMAPCRIPWTPEEVVNHVITHMEEIAQQCANDKQSLLMCSILPTSRPDSEADQARNESIVEMNRKIRAIAEHHGFIYVDYHQHFVDNDGLKIRDELSDDGVHPHIRGYEVMAQVLRDTLSNTNVTI